MRLLVTGKTRSGKSTSLHAFLSDALRRDCWIKVILFDGKGSELKPYTQLPPEIAWLLPTVTYFGPDQIEGFSTVLTNISEGLADRYTDLTGRGLRDAPAEDPRYLIIADEIQIACRDTTHGRTVKNSLTRIFEQSAALGDCVIITCQREQNSVPPNVRWNCSARLAMLGNGFFHYKPDALPQTSGKFQYIDPAAAIAKLRKPLNGTADLTVNTENFLALLHAHHSQQELDPTRANASLYLGDDGTGKTHALKHHPGQHTRTIYVDLQETTRRWITDIMTQCNGTFPSKITNVEAAELVELALRAEPTTLLLDNLDKATDKARPILRRLVNAAENVALSARPPKTPSAERKLNPFIPRCKIIRLAPLTNEEAHNLADKMLPAELPRRRATLRRITDMAAGHPATIESLCLQAKTGSLRELRHLEHTPTRINLAWVLFLPALILIVVWRYKVDSYLASAILLIALMLLRPVVYTLVRRTWKS